MCFQPIILLFHGLQKQTQHKVVRSVTRKTEQTDYYLHKKLFKILTPNDYEIIDYTLYLPIPSDTKVVYWVKHCKSTHSAHLKTWQEANRLNSQQLRSTNCKLNIVAVFKYDRLIGNMKTQNTPKKHKNKKEINANRKMHNVFIWYSRSTQTI